MKKYQVNRSLIKLKTKMKYYIIEEGKGFISTTCEVYNKENALILVKALNKKSKANKSSSKFHICELIED